MRPRGGPRRASSTVHTRDTFFRIVSQESLVCPRCADKTSVYPRHGPFDSLGEWVGLERYICTRCRRGFWHRAERRRRDEGGPVLEREGTAEPVRHDHDPAEPSRPDAALDALDVAPGPSAPGPPNLVALDEELARLRGKRKRR